jgi:anti-sigma regulatory factor (Ser/Thr protein kinase)
MTISEHRGKTLGGDQVKRVPGEDQYAPTGLPEAPPRVLDTCAPSRELVSMRFQPGRSAAAPRLARDALGKWLATIPCSDSVARDAQLVVSELTTNTIVHTLSAPTIVASFDEGRLRIEVHDQDRAPPRIRERSDASGGRGLRLVVAVTDGWGWTPTRSGKQVWTEILC